MHGITRSFVIEEVAPSLGYSVEERTISLDEIKQADEVFLTGTAAEVIGVNKIDAEVIGNGKVGDITHTLIEAFRTLVSENAPED